MKLSFIWSNTIDALPDYLIKSLSLMAVFWLIFAEMTTAQTLPSDNSDATPDTNHFDRDRLGDRPPVQQPIFVDPYDSQNFLDRGQEGLYFLPESESDSILDVDDEIEREVDDLETEERSQGK